MECVNCCGYPLTYFISRLSPCFHPFLDLVQIFLIYIRYSCGKRLILFFLSWVGMSRHESSWVTAGAASPWWQTSCCIFERQTATLCSRSPVRRPEFDMKGFGMVGAAGLTLGGLIHMQGSYVVLLVVYNSIYIWYMYNTYIINNVYCTFMSPQKRFVLFLILFWS